MHHPPNSLSMIDTQLELQELRRSLPNRCNDELNLHQKSKRNVEINLPRSGALKPSSSTNGSKVREGKDSNRQAKSPGRVLLIGLSFGDDLRRGEGVSLGRV